MSEASDPATGARALRKVRNRLVTFLGLLYFAAFIDRTNVGFAALQMNRDLGFSASVYGFGAGIFFLGYCLFEVPSNLILHRVGARRWIGRIMLTWAVLAGAMVFTRGPTSFYVLRFLLGVAEAGFFPGIIYYLTYWVPAAQRARLVGWFMTAIPISTALSSPLSAWILGFDGALGLAGWQWLFLAETLPSLALGIVVLRALVDRPAEARWLTAAERDWLTERLERERGASSAPAHAARLSSLASPRVLGLCLCFFGADLGLYGVVFWIPQILQASGFSTRGVGYGVAAAYGLGALAMLAWTAHSDRTRERTWHIALAALIGFAGLAVGSWVEQSPWLVLLAFTVGITGTLAMLPVFWTLPAALLRGAAAAGGIALINSVGNIGGFAGPFAVGWLREHTGSFGLGLMIVAGGLLLAAATAVRLGHDAAAEYGELPARAPRAA